jgi:hypothetical protein
MANEYKKPIKKIKISEKGNMLQDVWQQHTKYSGTDVTLAFCSCTGFTRIGKSCWR